MRTRAFGLDQATDGPSLGRLAYTALVEDRLELAAELAERALRMESDDEHALHVAARLAELRGDVAEAIRGWERIGGLSDWHIWRENLARLLLADGDPAQAAEEAEPAVESGHTCPWAFGVRAQAAWLRGDAAAARRDLERAWALARPHQRLAGGEDVWGLRALLAGDAEGAARLFDAYVAGPTVSAADRVRVARLRARGAVA